MNFWGCVDILSPLEILLFISHKYKAIFVHIQRTGGNSVQNIFEQYDPELIQTVPVAPEKNRTKHCYITDIHAAIDEDVFRRYLKFCVVRNPFDRMVSWYAFFKDGKNPGDARIKTDKSSGALRIFYHGLDLLERYRISTELYKKVWAKAFQARDHFRPNSAEEIAVRFTSIGQRVRSEINRRTHSFEEFIRLPRNDSAGLFERFYTNQFDYVSQDRQLLVDRVLRFEDLPQQFAALATELGFPGRLPHVNRSSRAAGYRDCYNLDTRAEIERRFRKDCEYFGYAF